MDRETGITALLLCYLLFSIGVKLGMGLMYWIVMIAAIAFVIENSDF